MKSFNAIQENKDKKILCMSLKNINVENLRNYSKKFGVSNFKCTVADIYTVIKSPGCCKLKSPKMRSQ